ncbi:Ferrous-iron efflux pump FieF [Burkholderiales bacterium]|nr:Ferrous-iron efflux pump FieF [Burkholderiales bacterium]
MEPYPAAPASPAPATQLDRLRRWSSYTSFLVAVLLAIAKISAWFATDSLSLLATVVDALVDIFASLVTVLGVRFAQRPADATHRFGHGKAESLAALIQALLLAGASGVLVVDGIRRIMAPPPLTHLSFGLNVIAGCTVVTVLLVIFESHVARRTQSQAIAADRSHHLSDVAANLAVLLALFLTRQTGWPHFDALFAMAIAGAFGWSAFVIARMATDTLLDRELSGEDRERISQLVLAHPSARGMHDLRTRSAGQHQFIEFHLELDSKLSVNEAHAIVDDIERSLKAALPYSEVIVHVEPENIDDERLDDRIRSGPDP